MNSIYYIHPFLCLTYFTYFCIYIHIHFLTVSIKASSCFTLQQKFLKKKTIFLKTNTHIHIALKYFLMIVILFLRRKCIF